MFPKLTGEPTDASMMNFSESGMLNVLDQMETLWLKEQKFINGDQISAADIWAACEIEQPSECKNLYFRVVFITL